MRVFCMENTDGFPTSFSVFGKFEDECARVQLCLLLFYYCLRNESSLRAGFKAYCLHDGTFEGAVWRMNSICESVCLRLLGEKEAAIAVHGVENENAEDSDDEDDGDLSGDEEDKDGRGRRRGAEQQAMDVERAWLAVDFLKNAAVASRGHDAESEARCGTPSIPIHSPQHPI